MRAESLALVILLILSVMHSGFTAEREHAILKELQEIKIYLEKKDKQ